jgi:hypothetical protein
MSVPLTKHTLPSHFVVNGLHGIRLNNASPPHFNALPPSFKALPMIAPPKMLKAIRPTILSAAQRLSLTGKHSLPMIQLSSA